MQDKTGPVLFLGVILILIFMSNTGRLSAIKTVITTDPNKTDPGTDLGNLVGGAIGKTVNLGSLDPTINGFGDGTMKGPIGGGGGTLVPKTQ